MPADAGSTLGETGADRRPAARAAGAPGARVARSLRLAVVTTGALIAASLLLRVMNPFGAPPPDVSDWVPHLWAIGALTLVGLTITWAPTLAWTSLIIAAAAAALASVGLVREVRTLTGDEPVPLLGALVVVALVVPPIIAAAYATSGGRGSRAFVALAWAASGALSVWLIASFVSRTLGGERGGVPEWLWLAVVGGLTGVGLARDLGPAFTRTRARLRAERSGDPYPGVRGSGSSSSALSAVRVFVDELVPGREAGRAEAAESERGRIAADLHAEVLPSLRRALAEAESGGTVERLAVDLRATVDEVEALLASRRSIVLEEMGLLAAIEWLAERTEERSTVRVEIVVGGAGPEPPDGTSGSGARPPRDVERAAFRVAQLALDNVAKHAPGARVEIRINVAPAMVSLRIADDGSGPAPDLAAAARAGRRGIPDMRAEARGCGASLDIGRGPGGRGTVIDFRWPG